MGTFACEFRLFECKHSNAHSSGIRIRQLLQPGAHCIHTYLRLFRCNAICSKMLGPYTHLLGRYRFLVTDGHGK